MSNKYIKLENLAYYDSSIKEYINNNIGAGNGVAIYDDYSHFPSTQGEEIVVCAKNNYFDTNNNLYSSGFYYWDISNSIYVKIDEFWGGILGKPFEDIDSSHFEIDGNGKLKIQQTILDDLQIRLDKKLENGDIVQGENITITTDANGKIKINCDIAVGKITTTDILSLF